MVRRTTLTICAAAFSLWAAFTGACRSTGESESAEEPASARSADVFRRTEAIQILQIVERRIAAAQYAGLEQYFAIPRDRTVGELASHLAVLRDNRELTAAGIDHLYQHGLFGPATEQLGEERMQSIGARFGVAASGCWALTKDGAEAIFCAGADGAFRLVRVNGIGRLGLDS